MKSRQSPEERLVHCRAMAEKCRGQVEFHAGEAIKATFEKLAEDYESEAEQLARDIESNQ